MTTDSGQPAAEKAQRAIRVYQDRDDWWIGYYRGPNHHYVCPLPTLVIRWRRTTHHHRGES